MEKKIPYKIYLEESELPRQWYNVRADMKNKPAPLLNPATLQPITFEELRTIFCDELARQELNDTDAYIDIPKEIREKSGKQKISRVFRDNEELSASFDLAGEIREQLRSSEFLIVVCSPRTRESRWVMQEIQTFIELRGREYILPVPLSF